MNPASGDMAHAALAPAAGSGRRGAIRINLLGPFELRTGEVLQSLSARKDRALLAILALSTGRSATRGRLAGFLWGDSPEARARDSLKQALLRLRRVLPRENGPVIEADRASVRLVPTVSVDAWEILDPAGAITPEPLLDLRRGVPLEGLEVPDPGFREWLLGERARLEEAYAAIALRVMHRAEQEGRVAAATRCARYLLAADPLNEEAVRLVIRHHLGRGEARQALQLFESLSDRLAAAVGVPPEPETVALVRQIRRDAQAAPRTRDRSEGPFVIVLPFATLGDDPTQAYFADGLTEDIITDLGRVRGLKVGARSQAFALRSRFGDPLEGARDLGASHLLEGLVRQVGDAVRVNARLIETEGGGQVWAGRYDRPVRDVFRLQDELSRSVVLALRGALSIEEELDWRRGTGNVEAFRLLLKARSFYLRGLDRHSLGTARLLLQRAIEADPAYAEAFALLATCEFYLSIRSSVSRDAERQCRVHAERAVRLEPELAQARAAIGLAHYNEGDYDRAEAELIRARDLDPDLFEPPFFLARNFRLRGDRAEAARLYATAAALRPEDYRVVSLLAEEHRAMGRSIETDAALAQAEERLLAAVDRHPDNLDALALGASVFAEMGRFDQAREWCDWALALGGDETLVQFNYNLMRAFVLMDDVASASVRLRQLSSMSPVVRARLSAWIATDRDIERARGHPEFQSVLKSLARD